jgi:hypothetical protein
MVATRWMVLLLTTSCYFFLSGCCCGTTTYTRSTYQSDATESYTSDLGRAYLVMGSTHTTASTGGLDSEDVYDEPYSLDVGFDTTDEYTEPVRVLAAQLVHQGETIVVHDPTSDPLEDHLRYDEGRGKQVARIEMPLGDSLPFVDGSTVQAIVVVDLPWEESETTLEVEFVGNQSESSGTIWDAWMGV